MCVGQYGTHWNTGKKMYQLPDGHWHGSLFRRGGFFGELPCRKAGAQQIATICNQKTRESSESAGGQTGGPSPLGLDLNHFEPF